MQTDILTKLYTEKKQEIFLIWRDLMLLIISIGKSNIELIITIKKDMSENYEQILSITNSIGGANMFTKVNIPYLMQGMINYILTSIKRTQVTYMWLQNVLSEWK
jgi:hypothetical protein